MRPFLCAALLCLAVAGTATAGRPEARNQGCGQGKLVLNARYRVANDVDTSVRGNNWAFDNYARTVRVWRKAGGAFCAASTYDGTFTTIGGPSPGGTATLPAGIRGTLKGSSITTFNARFTPAGQPVRGELGTKDFGCLSTDQKGDCSGTFDWLSAYFTSADGFKSFKYARYEFVYHATEGGKGTWTDVLIAGKLRTRGDIVPKRSKGK